MDPSRLKRLDRPGFRRGFVKAHLASGVAHQVRALREARGWSQGRLATALGLKGQSAVARLEDPAYGRHSLATLLRLGEAFDIALLVKFVPFSRFLREVEHLTPAALNAPSYTQERAQLHALATAPKRYDGLSINATTHAGGYAPVALHASPRRAFSVSPPSRGGGYRAAQLDGRP
ncbi:helix-turn-helix domain-containing protein [Thiorhodovibrio frisius]|uniref:Putative transcriptional regulator n=1 Tax=Thiorhodovibrio frisius TaxID=631362 RepID=H8YVX6_9GAMM|nr:helix-turn-helix transcriptional regulator [Thiorhodovibrio frisius]EIC23767.1 putative transcriptional regulator [Thiorhodovibrio frisius]WPL20181.1 hypothetical protein Thiofri_00249 [Thiorhodovibrio frisius]